MPLPRTPQFRRRQGWPDRGHLHRDDRRRSPRALLHWLEIALGCIGIGAAITVGLTVRRRWRQHQALPQGRYVPWMRPQLQRQQLDAQPPPASVDGGQHLHLGGLTATERAEVMRQLRGGQ